jgi:hypothetical protein
MLKLILPFLFLLISGFVISQWNFVSTPASSTTPLNFAEINDNLNICLIGNEDIFRSTDQGNTFQKILDDQTYFTSFYHFEDAIIVNSQKYIAVGNSFTGGGIIAITNDGGVNWSMTTLNNGLNAIEFFNNDIVVVGDNGVLMYSSNLGNSWSNITSGVPNDLTNVIHNSYINQWVIGGSGARLKSFNGMIWSHELINYDIVDINFRYDKIIESLSGVSLSNGVNTSDVVRVYDSNFNLIDTVNCKLTGLTSCDLISDGRLIVGGATINMSDVSTYNLFFTDYFAHNGVQSSVEKEIYDIEAGLNYALVVGYDGAIVRYNLTDPLVKYVKSDFNSLNNVYCSGEVIELIPTYNQFDSCYWMFDNNIISNNDTLNLIVPNNNDLHNVSLSVYYNGIINTTSKGFNSKNNDQYITPNIFLSTDTIFCSNTTPSINVQSNLNTYSKFKCKIINLNTGDLITDFTIGQTSSLVSTFLTDCGTSGNYKLVIYIDFCGYEERIVKYYNMYRDQIINNVESLNDTVGICSNSNLTFISLINTLDNYTYIINTDSYHKDTVFGQTNDTISFYSTVGYNGDQYSTGWLYMDIKSPFGCVLRDQFLSRIVYNTPKKNFKISRYNSIDDSLLVIPVPGEYKEFWSVSPSISLLQNETNNVPIVSSNLVGDYRLYHTATTKYNCSDTNSAPFVFGNSISEEEDDICYISKAQRHQTMESVLDSKGNIIQLSWMNYGAYGKVPVYFIRKIDQIGNVLWTKTINLTQLNDVQLLGGAAIVATNVDVDKDDNIYISFSAKKKGDAITFENITITPESNSYTTDKSYIVKYSPNGNIVVSMEVSTGGISDLKIINGRIYAVVVEDSHSSSYPDAIYILECDLELQNLTYHSMGLSGQGPISTSSLTYDGGGSMVTQIYKYPQIFDLENNKIFLHYFSSSEIGMYCNLNDYSYTSGTIPEAFNSQMTIDDEGNIYRISSEQQYHDNNSLSWDGDFRGISFVEKFDHNFNQLWIKKCAGILTSISYIEKYDRLNIMGGSNYNYAFEGQNGVFDVIRFKDNPDEFTSVIYYEVTKDGDLYASNALKIGIQTATDLPRYITTQTDFVGNKYIFCNNSTTNIYAPDMTVKINDVVTIADSVLMIKISNNNCAENESFFNLSNNDTLNICSLTTSDGLFSIDISQKFKIDSIKYWVYNDTNLLIDSIDYIGDNSIDFTLNGYSQLKLITMYNDSLYDTLILISVVNQPVTLLFDTLMCKMSSQIILPPNSIETFYVNGQKLDSTGYQLNVGRVQGNLFHFEYKIKYQNGCLISDTKSVSLITPNYNSYQFLKPLCSNEHQVIVASEASNQNYWEYETVESDTFKYSVDYLYAAGTYSKKISYTDTNGCFVIDTVTFTTRNPFVLPLQSQYTLGLGNTLYFNNNPNWTEIVSAHWSNGLTSLIGIYHYADLPNYTNYEYVDYIDNYGCSNHENFIIIKYNYTGLEEEGINQLEFSPNPVIDDLLIKSKDQKITSYQILSSNGTILEEEMINADEINVDMTEFSPGIYLVKLIMNNSEMRYLKILKN